LISAAMVKNAVSTLVAFLAEVSRKGMSNLSAKAWVYTSVCVCVCVSVSVCVCANVCPCQCVSLSVCI
jgi:hypothetical protein